MVNLKINDSYHISEIRVSDQDAYVEHFKCKQIHDQTLNIPYPYSAADAQWWIQHNLDFQRQHGCSLNWAIRLSDTDQLIGGIGLHNFAPGKSHQAELGYWLAQPFWNQGIATAAVRVASEYSFKQFHIHRLTAHIFDFNVASARVLEKCGFHCEGVLRDHYLKNGRRYDGRLFAKIRDKSFVQQVSSGAIWEEKVGYCRAIRMGSSIAVTGTVAIDDSGRPFAVGQPYEQTKKCLQIIEKALVQLGARKQNILRTRLFVTDISNWGEFGRAHREFFSEHRPATSMIEIKSLIAPEFLIEIEADAVL